MSNSFNLDFNQDQLSELHDLCEQQTKHAYDAVGEGLFQATREFARSLSPVYDCEGNVLEEDTPEWEEWAEAVDNLVWIENYQVQDFDAIAFRKAQLEARLATN